MLIYLLLLFLLQIVLIPQSDSILISNEEKLEILFQDESIDDPDFLDRLKELEANPCDLNSVDLNTLLSLPFVNLSVANAIVNYRLKYGRFFSVAELNNVEGIDKISLEYIYRFFTVKNTHTQEKESLPQIKSSLTPKTAFFRLRQLTIPFLANDNNNTFIGSSGVMLKSYLRGIYDSEKLFVNILMEKDRGEMNFLDFYSGNLSYKTESFIKQVSLGDFYVQFGQGLILWTPYRIPKSISINLPVLRKARTIIPSKSSEENRFFRGAAIAINYQILDLSIFYSQNKIDAAVSDDGVVSSLPSDGFHRTDNEINKKDKLKESTLGSIINLNLFENFKTGLCIVNSKYDKLIDVESINNLLNKNTVSHYSFFYEYLNSGFNLSGEIASDGSSVSSINSLQTEIAKGLLFVFSVRKYAKNFYSLHASSFGEHALNSDNESGFYSALSLSTKIGKFTLYIDKYNVENNGKGNEYFLDFSSKILSRLLFNLRVKYEIKENLDRNLFTKIYNESEKGAIRMEVLFKLLSDVRFKTRIEISSLKNKVENESETGYLIFQDVSFTPSKLLDPKISFSARMIFFNSDSFNSGFYIFENDLPGMMSTKQLSGEGFRWYLLIKSVVNNNINISLKYSETFKAMNKNSSNISKFDSSLGLQFDVNF